MTINPISSADVSKAAQASTKFTENFETFLTLLTTQLQNQDPLEPMDPSEFTNQLVQFTGVEQSIRTNANLEQLVALTNQNELSTAVSLIGKRIEASETRSPLQNGNASWSYSLNEQAEEVTLKVLNDSRITVFSTAGEKALGSHEFNWDGKDASGNSLPDGKYNLLITAKSKSGDNISSQINMIGPVSGVFSRDGVNMVDVEGLSVPISEIISVKRENAQ